MPSDKDSVAIERIGGGGGEDELPQLVIEKLMIRKPAQNRILLGPGVFLEFISYSTSHQDSSTRISDFNPIFRLETTPTVISCQPNHTPATAVWLAGLVSSSAALPRTVPALIGFEVQRPCSTQDGSDDGRSAEKIASDEKFELVLRSVGVGTSDAFALGYGYGLAGICVRKMIDLTAGPADFDAVGFVVLGEAEGEDQFAGGEVAGAAAKHLCLGFTRGGEAHNSADAVAVGFCADQFDAQAAIRNGGALSFVSKQVRGASVGGEEQVEAAVIIDIGVGGAASNAGRSESLPDGFGDFFKFSFANIAK